MGRLSQSVALSLVVVSAALSCGPSRDAAFTPVRDRIEERTGQRAEWREDDPRERALDEAVTALLERELDLDSAAQLALLHSHALQARFADVGIARAQLVQATLLANPRLSGEVLFPITGDEVRGAVGVELDFLSSLFRSSRRQIAVAGLEATQLEVARDAVALAFEARAALIAHLEAKQRLALLEQVREAAWLSDEITARMREAGNVTRLSRLDDQVVLLDADARLLEQRRALVRSRESLSRVLGVPSGAWRVGEELPPLDDESFEELERLALEQSLELEALRRRVDVAGRALGLESARRFLPALEVGAELEQEEGWFAGPSASLTLPLLDVGQGRMAAREAELRQLLERYGATFVEVRADARRVHEELASAREIARRYSEQLVVLADERLEEAVLHYNAMTIGVLDLLERKRTQLDARERKAAALGRAWRLSLEAEALLAGVRLRAERPTMGPVPRDTTQDPARGTARTTSSRFEEAP